MRQSYSFLSMFDYGCLCYKINNETMKKQTMKKTKCFSRPVIMGFTTHQKVLSVHFKTMESISEFCLSNFIILYI